MTLRTPLAAIALALLTASAAQAHTTPRVDLRQDRQAQRIDQGLASGELTRREARRLAAEQRQIQRFEGHAKADGVVTARERAHLHSLQNEASRDIRHQKHDAQVARTR